MDSLMQLLYKVGDMLTLQFIKKALAGAGLGLSSYAGLTTLMDKVLRDSTSMLYSGDSTALAILGLGGVDTALSMIISACFVRAGITASQVFVTKL